MRPNKPQEMVMKARRLKSVYRNEKPASTPKPGFFDAQNEMIGHWDRKFKQMMVEIKQDVARIIDKNE